MKLVLAVVFIIFLLLIVPGILSLAIRKIPSGFQPTLSDSQSINQKESVKQILRAKNNYLSGIGLSIKNPYFRNGKDLIFDLFDDQNQLIRTVKLNGKNIADGNFVIISFEPVETSQGKFFSFMLTAPDAVPAEALEVYHSQQKSSQGEIYSVNNIEQNGQLSFVSYYTPGNFLANPITIYRNWIYKFFQDLPFAVFYLLTLFLGLGVLLGTSFKDFNRILKS